MKQNTRTHQKRSIMNMYRVGEVYNRPRKRLGTKENARACVVLTRGVKRGETEKKCSDPTTAFKGIEVKAAENIKNSIATFIFMTN